ncbi:MAG: DUF1841 family protein [Burkholderiaceae bacterium]
MFNPSRDDVRRFFRDLLAKKRAGSVLTPLEAIAGDWIEEHPEYFPALAPVAAGEPDPYEAREGAPNPFLHLSMHLSIAEQLAIDQPPGIKAAVERLTRSLGSIHDAHHEVMECLGEMLWTAQRNRAAPDGEAYVQCVEGRARGKLPTRH